MAIARNQIVHPEICRHYHIIGRCVRRTFLCGYDEKTQTDYEHRRGWIVERLELLTQAFCIDVVGYAVMSNHYHLILHLNPGVNELWSEDEVYARWSLIYSPPEWVREVRAGRGRETEVAAYQTWLKNRRGYLGDLSWFMKCLNEPIAKLANAEERCTGAFWEGRFKSQALMNEKALFACMAYVDLNPIRAKMAKTPEASQYTSVRQRIRAILSQEAETTLALMPFVDEVHQREAPPPTIPCTLTAYLDLVDLTGKAVSPGKRGTIPTSARPILQRLGLDETSWLQAVKSFEERQCPAVGSAKQLQHMATSLRDTPRAWYSGYRTLAAFFD